MSKQRLCKALLRMRGVSGETIVETLVSILIGSLALLMLAAAIGSSSRIITQSKKTMDEHYSSESALVDGTATPVSTTATATIVVQGSGGTATTMQTIDGVSVYADTRNANLPIARYVKSSAVSGTGGGA